MCRWCAKHRILTTLIWTVLTALLLLFMGLIGASIWKLIEIALLMPAFGLLIPYICANQLLVKTNKALNDHCDPYPMLQEVQEQLSYNSYPTYKQLLRINYSCALVNIGAYQQALEQLESHVDKYTPTLLVSKTAYYITYYNNLSAVLLALNEVDKAEMWYEKTVQLLPKLKLPLHKKMLVPSVQLTGAEIAYAKQDYAKAVDMIRNTPDISRRMSVSKALLYAKICIAQNQWDQAVSSLQYVIANGNRLVHVQIARDLLNQINYGAQQNSQGAPSPNE